jgi:farnesyl diphosphate synthase
MGLYHSPPLGQEKVAEIRRQIEAVDESSGMKREVYESFLAKIYKWQK